MIKLIVLTLFFFIVSSCAVNENNNKCDKFKSNLEYLKKSIVDEDGTYNVYEIEKKIEFLESQSGIKNKDQGNLLGKFIVTQEDILLWEKWSEKNCGNGSN